MSSEPNIGGEGSGKRKPKRSYRSRNKNKQRHNKQDCQNELLSHYRNVSFRERMASGQPGSPHRYFENSYDVLFNGNGIESCDGSPPSEKGSGEVEGEESAETETSQPGDAVDGQGKDANPAHKQSRGEQVQVVHRHLNGLCIITAGNVLKQIVKSKQASEGEGGNDNEDGQNIEISSIKYLVKIGKDSQSARGKLRTKNKRQKHRAGDGNDKAVEDHDGSVSPHDPLCEITLSNGTKIQLKCCVSGTVIELNSRLDSDNAVGLDTGLEHKERSAEDDDRDEIMNSSGDASEDETGDAEGVILGSPDPSLVLRDPLLDGHLAVIMPTWGSFPPKGKD